MAGIAIVTSPILVLVAFTAESTGAFARPLGVIVRKVVQITWYRSIISRHYSGSGYTSRRDQVDRIL